MYHFKYVGENLIWTSPNFYPLPMMFTLSLTLFQVNNAVKCRGSHFHIAV